MLSNEDGMLLNIGKKSLPKLSKSFSDNEFKIKEGKFNEAILNVDLIV